MVVTHVHVFHSVRSTKPNKTKETVIGVLVDLSGEFQDKSDLNAQASERRARDHDDLQNEIAGRHVGRHKRFLISGGTDGSDAKERKAARDARTALDLMLLDPRYAKLYNSAMDALVDAEAKATETIELAVQALQQAREDLNDILDRAATLPDGTKVFRDAKGNIWTENDVLVDDVQAESIVWHGDEPTHEEYQTRKDMVRDVEDYLSQWRHYETDVLGQARDRLTDQDNPLSASEVEGLKQDIESQQPILKNSDALAATDTPELSANGKTSLDVAKPF